MGLGKALIVPGSIRNGKTHHSVFRTLLGRREAARLVDVPWAAKVPRVIALGLVVRVALDPVCMTIGRIGDDPVQQPHSQPMTPIRRGYEKT